MALKRLFDIAASAVALWVLSPLLVASRSLIKLTSRGPVFFKQERVGMHGKPFHMLKFRSMVVNAEELKAKLVAQNEQNGPVFKMKNDPRITARRPLHPQVHHRRAAAAHQRAARRDERRRARARRCPREVAKYEPWQRRRLSVRPGLTCIWQVSGRNQISFEEWMYLDMQYIDHWSLGQDFNLILKTVPVVLDGQRGQLARSARASRASGLARVLALLRGPLREQGERSSGCKSSALHAGVERRARRVSHQHR